MEWHLMFVGIIIIAVPGVCQLPDPECYAVDEQYFVEIPLSAYGNDTKIGFKNAEAKTRCSGYCHTPENALYYGLQRKGPETSRMRCYCADTLPGATTTGCDYCKDTQHPACGGKDLISIYQVCPTNCKDNNCEVTDSTCIGCTNGYYGDVCDGSCPQNCASDRCQQTSGVCDGCDDGYYGDFCDNQCPGSCINNNCEQYHCTEGCVPGHYGDLCSECPDNCKDGLCDPVSGDCTQCDGDFYGNKCNITCPTNCDGQCGQFTGNCPACQTGWYGNKCDKRCTSNCLNHTCDQIDETCTYGCVDGWYGNLCNKLCPPTCKQKCNRGSGDCTNPCDGGFYGNQCKQICPSQCADRLCDFTEGSCTNGCTQWYAGPKCETLSCPTNCLNADCDGSDGHCLQGCVDGYHGDRCDDICPTDCKERSCTSGGLCKGGCKPGWYGPRCTEVCSTNCVSLSCDKETGACTDGCQNGWTGHVCALSQTGVLSEGGKVGVSISVVAVLGVAIAVSVFFLRRKKRRESKQTDNHVPFTDVTSSPTATSSTSELIYENGTVEDANVDKVLHYLQHRTPDMLQAEFKELQGNNALRIPARTEASIAKYQTRVCCYLMMSLPPTQETLSQLIRENNCDTVVTLLTAQQAQIAPYLVTVKDDKSGDYEKLSTHKPGIKTDFRIIKAPPRLISGSHIIPDSKNQVGVFSITMEENVECLDPKSTIEVSKEIHAWCHRQRIVKPHILILCFDGVRYSGQFVAMCGLFEAINESRNIDVLRCVKQLKSIRHGFIGSLEQYLNLHEACREFIERETNTYAAIQH